MKGKAIIPLAVGLGVGLLAIKFAVDAIQKAQGSTANIPEVNVVVATTDIGPTMALSADMLVVKKTPKSPLIPPNAYEKVEEVVGRVTSKTILAGTALNPMLLAPEGTLPGLGVKIEEGYRAVSVKIDEVTGVAYQLLPGAHVDVLVVMDVKDGQKKETISRVILQRVQVAAVGQHLGDPNDEGTNTKAKSVTLLVKAEDVPKLHLAQTKGKITLAMRSSEDEMMASMENALESQILGTPPREAEPVDTAPSTPKLPGQLPSMAASSLMQDAPPARPPFTTTVINGPVASKAAGQVLRVTYKDAASMDVVAVQEGRTSGDDGSLRFGATSSRGEETAGARRLFNDRDRTLRRLGARDETNTGERAGESDPEMMEDGE